MTKIRAAVMWGMLGAIAVGAAAQTPVKPMTFDVVSIRKSAPSDGRRVEPMGGATADGYQVSAMPLMLVLLSAYVPSPGHGTVYSYGQIVGVPEWLRQDGYDLTAKVSDAEMADWQRPELRAAMLGPMLQAMFAERCKMTVHRELKTGPVMFLDAPKGAAMLKETDPAQTHVGMNIPFGDGGVMVPAKEGMQAYGISMGTLSMFLSTMTRGAPVVDRTGLKGRYDVMLPMRERTPPGEDFQSAVDESLRKLGLKLTSGKSESETLVIDHVERPTEN